MGNFSLLSVFGGVYFGKLVLKEVVDVVLNFFVKYMYGYGRGKFIVCYIIFNVMNELNGLYDKVFEQKLVYLMFVFLFVFLFSVIMMFKFFI